MTSPLDELTPADHMKLARRATRLAGRDAGRDLLQDAYLKALECSASRRGGSSAFTWVYGFLGNLHMNRNTVEFGRGTRPGRRALLVQYRNEYRRLNLPHGRRVATQHRADA